VVPLDAGWSDVGSWAALWAVSERDENGNVVVGDVAAVDTRGSYLRSESRLLAAVGIEDMIVVETPDAILAAPMSRAQDVRDIVTGLKDADRVEADRHRRRVTGFGSVEELARGVGFRVNRLSLRPGSRMRLRRHDHRAERWVVVRGTGILVVGDDRRTVVAGDTTFIPAGVPHYVDNPSSQRLVIVEVELGSYLADDDIVVSAGPAVEGGADRDQGS
jgi:mannose-1-phosphate guanylyltransferase/mannose-6-phosphate isomerase